MAALKNARHELFAQGLAKGKSQTQAYIDAGYDAVTARQQAAKLVTNGNIQKRVDELKERAAIKVEYTIEDMVREYEEARQMAIRVENPSAMVSAVTGKGTALGIIINKSKSEITGNEGAPIRFEYIMPKTDGVSSLEDYES